jgi:hypothetical protein
MANKQNSKTADSPIGKSTKFLIWGTVALLALGGAAFAILNGNARGTDSKTSPPAASLVGPVSSPAALVQTPASSTAEPPTIDINQAVMVTVELDFGAQIPSIATALRQIDRRYEPADGQGRTFAILDAYGEATSDGKKLHISMHVSTEKPGIGQLVFRKTGEVLWKSKIVTTNSHYFSHKNLLILFTDENGKGYTVDGSSNPISILEANLKELGVSLKSIWPDGAEREFTYIYSACGCPVKVKVKRVGDRTERTQELPVMFPDDPAAVQVISTLMRWK